MESETALKISNYKCFGDDPQGFSRILALNLIIGRNNSGKSALLDLVQFAITPLDLAAHARLGMDPEVHMTLALTDDWVRRVFDSHTSGGGIPGPNHLHFGLTLQGSSLTLRKLWKEKRPLYELVETSAKYPNEASDYFHQKLPNHTPDPFVGCRFRRLDAERDIRREAESTPLDVGSSGAGMTNLVRAFLTHTELDRDIVERTMLDDLNSIMRPDASYSRIDALKAPDGHWEIFLNEEGKGRIGLSASGSGLKTVLLVLAYLRLIPLLEKAKLSDYVFAFEELENNLHPALQRRLLRFIMKQIVDASSTCFIATHSPVIIDMFGSEPSAQILHVLPGGASASVEPIATQGKGFEVLDDLGVRASDILQANGVVWVEGISDRILIRRWFELICQELGKQPPVEGSEYVFVEYGGSCLSHYQYCSDYTADLEEALASVMPALSLSRNHFVVMDSDRSSADGPLTATKDRVIAEAAHTWVTAGRTVENYLPDQVQADLLGRALGRFELMTDCKANIDKKAFAEKAAAVLPEDGWKTLDLEERVVELLDAIAAWND
ncbi:MAG: ATP-binding protein [Actinobacteria bacterium]|nr:ATP-binding protein [Actinomycetota bacterium]